MGRGRRDHGGYLRNCYHDAKLVCCNVLHRSEFVLIPAPVLSTSFLAFKRCASETLRSQPLFGNQGLVPTVRNIITMTMTIVVYRRLAIELAFLAMGLVFRMSAASRMCISHSCNLTMRRKRENRASTKRADSIRPDEVLRL